MMERHGRRESCSVPEHRPPGGDLPDRPARHRWPSAGGREDGPRAADLDSPGRGERRASQRRPDCRRSAPLVEGSLVRDALVLRPRWPGWAIQADRLAFDGKAIEATRLPSLVAGYRADPKLDGNDFDQRAYLALRYELRTGGDLGGPERRRAGEGYSSSGPCTGETRRILRRPSGRGSAPTGPPIAAGLRFTGRSSRFEGWSRRESHLRRFLVGRSSWRDVLSAQREVAEARAAQIDVARSDLRSRIVVARLVDRGRGCGPVAKEPASADRTPGAHGSQLRGRLARLLSDLSSGHGASVSSGRFERAPRRGGARSGCRRYRAHRAVSGRGTIPPRGGVFYRAGPVADRAATSRPSCCCLTAAY